MALLEAARTRRAAGQPRPLVIRAFQQAIEAAESTRRGWLVDFVETEIEQFDPLWMAKRVQERLRGRQVKAPTTSLVAAERETGSVLYLDMQESTSFARARDPEYVLMVVNQLLGGLADEVNSFGGQISSYRGDGFMALWRGMDHPRRAVEASLALVNCTEQFNQPLRQLGHKPIEVRIGIATGELCFGNIGTYEKMDYTAIGATANLGARLESIAEPGKPCLSAATREAVGELFEFTAAAPQWVELKGMGRQACWHLLKRSDEPPMAR
jgi:adenylate cyclase